MRIFRISEDGSAVDVKISRVRKLGGALLDHVVEANEILSLERDHINDITDYGSTLSDRARRAQQATWLSINKGLQYMHTLANLIASGSSSDWALAEENGIKRTHFGREEKTPRLWKDEKERQAAPASAGGDDGRPSEEVAAEPPAGSRGALLVLEGSRVNSDIVKRISKYVYSNLNKLKSEIERFETDGWPTIDEVHGNKILTTAISLLGLVRARRSLKDENLLKRLIPGKLVGETNGQIRSIVEKLDRNPESLPEFWADAFKEIYENAEELDTAGSFFSFSDSQEMIKTAKVTTRYRDQVQDLYGKVLSDIDEERMLQRAFTVNANKIASIIQKMFQIISSMDRNEMPQEDAEYAVRVMDGLKWAGRLASTMLKRGEDAAREWDSIKKDGLKMMSDEDMAVLVVDLNGDHAVEEEDIVGNIVTRVEESKPPEPEPATPQEEAEEVVGEGSVLDDVDEQKEGFEASDDIPETYRQLFDVLYTMAVNDNMVFIENIRNVLNSPSPIDDDPVRFYLASQMATWIEGDNGPGVLNNLTPEQFRARLDNGSKFMRDLVLPSSFVHFLQNYAEEPLAQQDLTGRVERLVAAINKYYADTGVETPEEIDAEEPPVDESPAEDAPGLDHFENVYEKAVTDIYGFIDDIVKTDVRADSAAAFVASQLADEITVLESYVKDPVFKIMDFQLNIENAAKMLDGNAERKRNLDAFGAGEIDDEDVDKAIYLQFVLGKYLEAKANLESDNLEDRPTKFERQRQEVGNLLSAANAGDVAGLVRAANEAARSLEDDDADWNIPMLYAIRYLAESTDMFKDAMSIKYAGFSRYMAFGANLRNKIQGLVLRWDDPTTLNDLTEFSNDIKAVQDAASMVGDFVQTVDRMAKVNGDYTEEESPLNESQQEAPAEETAPAAEKGQQLRLRPQEPQLSRGDPVEQQPSVEEPPQPSVEEPPQPSVEEPPQQPIEQSQESAAQQRDEVVERIINRLKSSALNRFKTPLVRDYCEGLFDELMLPGKFSTAAADAIKNDRGAFTALVGARINAAISKFKKKEVANPNADAAELVAEIESRAGNQ